MAIKKSAGLVIIYGDEILLVHPTGSSWKGTYSIPKGEIKYFEDPLTAAIRETEEEIGLNFSNHFKDYNCIMDGIISYKKNGNGKTYKRVFYYIIRLNEKPEIDKNKLQKQEVDWAGFVRKDEAEKRIFWRFKPILEKVFELEN